MESWLVLLVSALYIGLLFAIAWYGDRRSEPPAAVRLSQPLLYALTLGVYNTAWSFYGSVGRAATHGYDFFAIYLGPILVLLLGRRMLARIVSAAKAQNITSIADFIAARYGKSQSLAGLVTVIAVVGILPYIALQLKGVATSYDVLTSLTDQTPRPQSPLHDTAFVVAALMALFSIMFGVRHIHTSEHHRGLMLAIAFESLVKLATFLLVSLFIIYGLFDGAGDLLSRALADPHLAFLFQPELAQSGWWSNLVLGAIAIVCLPQLFHVMVVENERPTHLAWARRLYPLYLVALSLPMLPIAIAGVVTFGRGTVNPDTFMLVLPIAGHHASMSLIAFIGGLSAATAMVVVGTVALSTMVCNDLVMPLLLRIPALRLAQRGDHTKLLLAIRRSAVVAILLLGYATYRMADQRYSLVSIGLVSFVAIAQFAPAFFGGLFWSQGNRNGAVAGLVVGVAVWSLALAPPPFGTSAVLPTMLNTAAPIGSAWGWLQSFLGGVTLDPIAQATLWSLLLNLAAYVLVSLATRPSALERLQADLFVRAGDRTAVSRQLFGASATRGELKVLATRFLGPERAALAFHDHAARHGPPEPVPEADSTPANVDLVSFTERLLAGAIGAASARVVLATTLQGKMLSRRDAMRILDQASEAITLNRELLQATLENMIQGICVLDRSLRFATWNQRFLDLLDLPNDLVLVGTHLNDVIRFNARRGEGLGGDVQTVLLNRDRLSERWPYRYERTRPDGTVLDFAWSRMPEGGFVMTVTDVTERHRAAAALKEANESLERRVEERTVALQAAKAEAERANLGKTRFLAAASHDLLQPLNAARLFASTLAARMRQFGKEPVVLETRDRQLVEHIDASLRSVEQLLGDLLDISALDSGGMRPEFAEFRVDTLLATLGVEFAAIAEQRGLALKLVGTRATVCSDARMLRRILQNFLSNALRYTREGRVLLGCRRRGAQLAIEVWDTGPGIPADKLGEIFQEFRRLRREGERDGGLGLGLAIVERMARMLDHPVSVQSRPGVATCFSVIVPLAAAPLGASAQAPLPSGAGRANEPGDLAGALLLCIDNDRAILRGMAELLESWSARVVVAEGAADAAAALGSRVPDAVLADYHLDGIDGIELLDRLRAGWPRPVPGLLITADRCPALQAAAGARGYGLLHKPLRPGALRALLRHSLSTSAQKADAMAELP